MILSELRLASVSDIHLGHRKTPTRLIVDNLIAAFPYGAETAKLDILILAGDVFDRMLNLPQHEVDDIERAVTYFLRLCKKHNITLMILEGTPDHDRKQSRMFVKFNTLLGIDCDLHYVQELEVRYFPKFGVHILFVPDCWSDTAEKTLADSIEAITAHGLKKVDFAVMHGQFEYQLPPVVKAQKHNSDAYLSIVDKLIFIGHVHQFSRNDRIVAQGSFDRLSYGDEMPKGHVRAVVRASDDYELTFVENKGAKIYKDIHCHGLTLEETHAKIDAAVGDLPEASAVRVVAEKTHPILTHLAELQRTYNLLTWDVKGESVGEQALQEQILKETEEYIPPAITRENISRLVLDVMLSRNAEDRLIKLAEKKLLEIR